MFVSTRALLGCALFFAGLSHATLTVRAGNEIPSQCTSQCSALVTAVTNCPTESPSCLCTSDVNNGLQTCYSCLLGLDVNGASSDQAIVQAEIAKYETLCNEASFSLSSVTVTIPAATATVPASEQISSLPDFTFSVSPGSSAPTSKPSNAASAHTSRNAGLFAGLGIASLFFV